MNHTRSNARPSNANDPTPRNAGRPAPRVMDLRRIKQHVRCNLDPAHPLRMALLAEPDEVPVDDVLLGRLLVMVRLTYQHGGAVTTTANRW